MQTMRFGRRLPIPSTLQIRRDLIALMHEDARRDAVKAAESAGLLDEIGVPARPDPMLLIG